MSQLSYPLSQPLGLVGQLADVDPSVRAIARTYAKRRHRVVVSLGGTDNGTYSIRVTPPSGVLPSSAVTGSFAASGDTADDIVTELADALNTATETINGVSRPALRPFAHATADTAGDDVIIEAARAGEPFTVAFPSNPNTNLTQSTAVDATPTTIPYGIGVCFDGDDNARLPTSGDTPANVAGVLKRGKQIEAPDDGSAEYHDEGDSLEIVTHGRIFVMPEDDVAVGDAVYLRVAGTGQLGAFRGTPTGDAQASTIVPVADQAQYAFRMEVGGRSFTAIYQPTDGTTAVADAIDGLYDAIVELLGGATSAANGLGVTVTESDTALTLTTDDGVVLDSLENAAWNADTEAASCVATLGTPDAEAIALPAQNFRWLRSGGPTSGEPAILAVNLA